MLKADFHMHTSEDPYHKQSIPYNAQSVIKFLAKKNYTTIAITQHDKITYSQTLARYAKKQGILLIPGVERSLKEGHVLMLGSTQMPHKVKDMNDLYTVKDKYFLMPAHPNHKGDSCIGMKQLVQHKKLWNAVEYSSCRWRGYNPNKKVQEWCKKNKIPMLGNSDAHRLYQFNHTYSIIDTDKNTQDSVFTAIAKNKVQVHTQNYPLSVMLRAAKRHILSTAQRKIKQIKK